ncbi:hypothetical protein EDB81DRAFT_459657 [Dactylonectria macrodidyma]|uniref:Uncharacterized protein n=1 Tax=Dactylonectria macrodidyma TaxID=307937 RepID=A0A9P9J8M5_9HYPO|nr:hypothetical protein EDB81DRAFT_459657 [Dactylonectria macrodidyma]
MFRDNATSADANSLHPSRRRRSLTIPTRVTLTNHDNTSLTHANCPRKGVEQKRPHKYRAIRLIPIPLASHRARASPKIAHQNTEKWCLGSTHTRPMEKGSPPATREIPPGKTTGGRVFLLFDSVDARPAARMGEDNIENSVPEVILLDVVTDEAERADRRVTSIITAQDTTRTRQIQYEADTPSIQKGPTVLNREAPHRIPHPPIHLSFTDTNGTEYTRQKLRGPDGREVRHLLALHPTRVGGGGGVTPIQRPSRPNPTPAKKIPPQQAAACFFFLLCMYVSLACVW